MYNQNAVIEKRVRILLRCVLFSLSQLAKRTRKKYIFSKPGLLLSPNFNLAKLREFNQSTQRCMPLPLLLYISVHVTVEFQATILNIFLISLQQRGGVKFCFLTSCTEQSCADCIWFNFINFEYLKPQIWKISQVTNLSNRCLSKEGSSDLQGTQWEQDLIRWIPVQPLPVLVYPEPQLTFRR